MKLVAGLFVACLALPSMAGIIRHDTPDSAYQNFAASPDFASAGAIIGSSSQGSYGCSGTAIDKHWMLTAAHCVQNANSMNFYLANGSGSFDSYAADSWIAHEMFDINNLLGGWDIGLVHFQQELNVPYASIYQGHSEVGSIGVITGFGTTGNGLTGTTSPFGTKRAGLNELTFAFSTEGDGEQILWGDFDPPADNNPLGAQDLFGDGYALLGEYAPSFGDSGGGLFVWDNNQFYLAGVNSFIVDANNNQKWSDYGDAFGITRVSSLSDWIESKISPANVPEPSGIVLALLGLLGIACRRVAK